MDTRRTEGDPINALRLLQKAVYLPHLTHPRFCPSFCRYDRLDLIAERLDILRVRG